ncbi:MAG: type VII secretion protein EssC, partial [Oscillospiraceae bacterium]|nr:type VII secretion protein EssC [Oscillospiraceae bacterium]
DDFMTLRAGSGSVPLRVNIKTPKQPLSLETDPLLEKGVQIAEKYAHVNDCPITFDILRNPTGGIIGDRRSAVALAQSLIVHAAAHHSYDELKIIVLSSPGELGSWRGARWLPHIFDNDRRERYIAADADGALAILNKFEDVITQRIRETSGADSSQTRMQLPFLLFICADAGMTERHGIMRCLTRNDPNLGVGAVFLFDDIAGLPKECSVIMDVSGDKGIIYSKDNSDAKEHFRLDSMNGAMLDDFARMMAPVRIENVFESAQLPASVSFLQGFGVGKPQELPIEANWQNSVPSRSMSVPIGVKQNGEPFRFDIHEKFYGPHGLVAGMTGSGKSEMVQSWILSMAVRFPPQAVSFVLIDFKGTGLILPFRSLPHLAGTISDLDTNIGRNLIALENELSRRKALLDQYGVSNISSYLNMYNEGKARESLAYLFVVIDEFAEFRVRFPDFMQAVDRIFAIGRTLGVHIILLTQKPANVVNEKMNANTRFRWCLKVAGSADSKDMLRHPDAAKITVPGRAYVQVGEDEVYEQIQTYWSGAPYNPERGPSIRRDAKISVVNLAGSRASYETEKTTGFRAEKNEIDAVVDHLDNYVRKNNIDRARNIWTDKLPEQVMLAEILTIAFDGEDWNNKNTGLYIPVGKIDDPRSQSQYPLRLAPHEEGHFAVYGAPGTGKTTLLQTTVMSAALSFPPDQVNIYIMDFGGGSMNIFRELPHVGGIAVAGEDEKIDKLAKLISRELDERRQKFSSLGIVSIDAYREASGEKLPYIILVLDNFAPVQGMYPELESFFVNMTRDGGSYGIYLLVSAVGAMGLPFRIAQNIKSAAALRMTDKGDYAAIVGRTDGLEPENNPGRGLIRNAPPLEFQSALPASGKSENERIASIRALAALMNEKWRGVRPAGIPVMPERVTLEMIKSKDICVGLGAEDMRPAALPGSNEPFTIISGKGEDKSVLLRVIIRQYSEKLHDASIALLDSPSGGLAPAKAYSGAYCSSGGDSDVYIDSLIPELNERRTRRAEDGASDFTPLVIAIDDLGTFFDAVSNETINRLAAITTLGSGLNVYLLAAGDIDDISKLYYGGDKLTMNMVDKATAVLLGG